MTRPNGPRGFTETNGMVLSDDVEKGNDTMEDWECSWNLDDEAEGEDVYFEAGRRVLRDITRRTILSMGTSGT